jgi:glycosyltransferase involved in cell wall biosynthesis
MKVTMLGLRGLPRVAGGVETHVEQLGRELTARGITVEVIGRTPYVKRGTSEFEGMRIVGLWAPRIAGVEALVHTILGVLWAALHRPQILHLHAVGPAIAAPLARALGLRVVVTHHGPDYDREKWGRFARGILRLGESWGMRWAQQRIAISQVIANLVREKYGLDSVVVPNGVQLPQTASDCTQLDRWGLAPGRYVLIVSRVVAEKRQTDLIQAFRRAALPAWKLVIAGGLGADDYGRQVQQLAQGTDVVLTGFVTGEPLQQLYAHAGVFVLPSSHEGLPIALLEALSHGVPVIASNIAAHQELMLGADSYFPLGDVEALADRLRSMAALPADPQARAARRQWVADRYDWADIATRILAIYRSVLAEG